MVFFGGVLGLLALGVWVFCIIDVITTPRDQVRNLPKFVWVLIVVLLIDLGSVAWLLAGRPWAARATTPGGAVPRGTSGAGTSSFGPRRRPTARPMNPDDDEDFLADLAKRNEEQRRERGDDPTS